VSNHRILNIGLTAFLTLAAVILLIDSIHLPSAGSSTILLSVVYHATDLPNQPEESFRFTSVSAGSGDPSGTPTPTRTRTPTPTSTPTPTKTPTCTPLPEPAVSIGVNPTVVNVGDTSVVTGSVTHMGLTYWTLHTDSGEIAHLRYDGSVFFYNNSPIVQAISGRGGHTNTSVTLKAVSPGTVNLWWIASGETGSFCQGWYLTLAGSGPVSVNVTGVSSIIYLPIVVRNTSPPTPTPTPTPIGFVYRLHPNKNDLVDSI